MANNIYMTELAYAAINTLTDARTSEQVEEESKEIYKILKERYCLLNWTGAEGEDRIMLMPERKTGKTTAVMTLAEELGLPIVVKNCYRGLYSSAGKDIKIICLEELRPEKWEGVKYYPHTVLVDRPTDAKEVRAALDRMRSRWGAVNILGIQ